MTRADNGGRAWWRRRWLACVLAALAGWLWSCWPAHHDGIQVAQRIHDMEQQEMQMINTGLWDESSSGSPGSLSRFPIENRPAHGSPPTHPALLSRPEGDVAALVRWHTLMRQHRLSGWQGRALPRSSTSAQAPDASDAPGNIWRLEGPATYAQGVALLDALVQDFPGVMLLHVQSRRTPDGQTLRWLVELRWTAVGMKLPPSVRWPQVQGVAIDPFSPDPLKPPPGEGLASLTAPRDVARGLAHVSVRSMRLAGVVSGDQGSQALVTAIASSGAIAASVIPGASPVPAWHVLREGQVVGEEQARVQSIEPGRVVLAQKGQADAKGQTPTWVLELASVASTFTSLPGRWQP